MKDNVKLGVACLCQWRVPGDHQDSEMTDELEVFKDADVLDRCGLAISILPSYAPGRRSNFLTPAKRCGQKLACRSVMIELSTRFSMRRRSRELW